MAETRHPQKKRIGTGGKGMTHYIPATQANPKKVTNMVGTFLNRESVKVPSTKMEPKKVTNMVGTFLNEKFI